MNSCEGCGYMQREDAGRGFEFCICTLGKFDYAHRPVFDRVLRGHKSLGPIPAWCKLGKGQKYGG